MVILSTVLLSPGLPRLVSHLESEGVPWVSADTFAKALVTAPAGVVAIFAVAGGWILDRIGRRPVLLAGLAVFGTCGVAGAFLSSPWALMASRIGVGFGLSGILLASTTLIGDYFDGSDRRRVLGWQIAVLSACSVVCLFMAAWLSQHSWRYPFGIYALSLCIVPWAWKQVDEPEEEEKLDDGDEDPEDRSASIAWSRISLIYVGSFLALAIFHLATTQMPGYLEELGYGSPYASAGLIAMMSLLAVPSSIGFDRVRNHLSDRSLLLIVFVFGGVGFAVAGFGTSLTFLLSGLAIFSLPYGFRTPALKSWLLDEAPGRYRGRLTGGLMASTFAGIFCSPLISNPLNARFGMPNVILIAAAAQSLLAIGFAYFAFAASKSDQSEEDRGQVDSTKHPGAARQSKAAA